MDFFSFLLIIVLVLIFQEILHFTLLSFLEEKVNGSFDIDLKTRKLKFVSTSVLIYYILTSIDEILIRSSHGNHDNFIIYVKDKNGISTGYQIFVTRKSW